MHKKEKPTSLEIGFFIFYYNRIYNFPVIFFIKSNPSSVLKYAASDENGLEPNSISSTFSFFPVVYVKVLPSFTRANTPCSTALIAKFLNFISIKINR